MAGRQGIIWPHVAELSLLGGLGWRRHPAEMCCGTEPGSYLRLIDSCITQLKAQGPSRACNESKEEEEELSSRLEG